METHEFWRERASLAIYAIRLTEGVVSGSCGPLQPSDVMVEYLPTFTYAGAGADDLEARREAFEILDEQALLYLSTTAD